MHQHKNKNWQQRTSTNVYYILLLLLVQTKLYFSIKIKGLKGFAKELAFQPFGKWMLPFNLVLKLIEEITKPLSLGLRLFGNLYATIKTEKRNTR